MNQIKIMLEELYINMDEKTLRNIERSLYGISDEIQDYRFTEEGKKIDYELNTLLRLFGIDIYSKTYKEIKDYILKLKNIVEFIELL